jgi:D-alanyl-D-alanine carboxypeptidase
MKRLILAVGAFSLFMLLLESCKPTVVDLNKYADKLEAQLKDKPYGYAFVVSRAGEKSVQRAGGWARLKQDPSEMKMSVDVKYSTASVSKNITAAAFLKLLDDTNIKDMSLADKLNEKIVGYLPYNWKPGSNVDTVTFRELLRHRAGIRCDPDFVDYQNLKKCLAQGIKVADKQTDCNDKPIGENQIGCYKNANYALFRAIIPVMLGKLKKPVLSTFTEEQTDTENAQYAANVYIGYVNDNVFAKAGLPKMFCRPTDGTLQGMTYKHAAPDGKGGDFGDQTLRCGSQGWFLSASQLATYFQALNTTNKVVPPAIASRMRDELLGYDEVAQFDTPDGKVTRWHKSGGHPAAKNAGEIKTLLMRFSNGVEVAVVINSDTPGFSYFDAVINSMSDLLNGK